MKEVLKTAINIVDYRYELPYERIAQYPLVERDKSKMLVYRNKSITDDKFFNLPEHVDSDAVIILNESKVIQARLLFTKKTGGKIEVFCLQPLNLTFEQALSQKASVVWKCLIGNRRIWKGQKLVIQKDGDLFLYAEVLDNDNVRFSWEPSSLSWYEVLWLFGHTPLPPYINRPDKEDDRDRYQTVFAEKPGSVAAPTAGLHFTDKLIARLQERGNTLVTIVLHTGAGTFMPVKTETIAEHVMHSEYISVGIETIEFLSNTDRQIVTVGTTAARTLESIYWAGVKLLENPDLEYDKLLPAQWEPYSLPTNYSKSEALTALFLYLKKNNIAAISGQTQLIIVPGYSFGLVDVLLTNFHQPESTLLLLVAAFTNSTWESLYQHALENDYRFLSYGDCCLLFR